MRKKLGNKCLGPDGGDSVGVAPACEFPVLGTEVEMYNPSQTTPPPACRPLNWRQLEASPTW